jgi:hypothetical protein
MSLIFCIFRLSRPPEVILIKVRNCSSVLFPGCDPGVYPLQLCIRNVQIEFPGKISTTSAVLAVYPFCPYFAATPEKMQGQTMDDGIHLTNLRKRHGSAKTALYVGISRPKTLTGLTLSEPITRDYLAYFKADRETLQASLTLIHKARAHLPQTASAADRTGYLTHLQKEEDLIMLNIT